MFLKKWIKNLIIIFNLTLICPFAYTKNLYGRLEMDLPSNFENMNMREWGTTASAIIVLIFAVLAILSLILPHKILKKTLGRVSWIGLFSAIVFYITMSFFGNSIQKLLF